MKNQSVKFHFQIKRYVPVRLRDNFEYGTLNEPIDVSGEKSFRLFSHWFRLMKNKNRLLFGVVELEDGKKYIWQPRTINKYGKKIGGWQLAYRPHPVQLSLF